MKCHNKTGTVSDLNSAIYNSCNTYFASIYKKTIEKFDNPKIGINVWKNHLKSFGFGNYLGYDHPTGQPGLIPGSDYYDRWYANDSWRAVTTISTGIYFVIRLAISRIVMFSKPALKIPVYSG